MRKRVIATYAILAALLIILVLLNILLGSSSVSAAESLRILFSHDTVSKYGKIVWDIRMPRILAAALLGGALAVSGFLLQTFFANPIAGPYILGISSGAKLVVACVMVFALARGMMVHSLVMIIAAFAGSLIVTGVILLISGKVKSMAVLIVCGVMVGYICSAVTEFLVTFADDSNIVNLHNWSMGSFSGINRRSDTTGKTKTAFRRAPDKRPFHPFRSGIGKESPRQRNLYRLISNRGKNFHALPKRSKSE